MQAIIDQHIDAGVRSFRICYDDYPEWHYSIGKLVWRSDIGRPLDYVKNELLDRYDSRPDVMFDVFKVSSKQGHIFQTVWNVSWH